MREQNYVRSNNIYWSDGCAISPQLTCSNMQMFCILNIKKELYKLLLLLQ